MKELAEASNNRRCFFRPDGKMRRDYFRKGWDVVQVLLLTYVALVVPYRTGFGLIICHEYTPFAFWFEVFVDVYFILDIVINFRTAFWDVNQELIIEPKAICFEYLKTWFFIDLAACFPITYIELLVSPRCARLPPYAPELRPAPSLTARAVRNLLLLGGPQRPAR
jgi:hypothetical protein